MFLMPCLFAFAFATHISTYPDGEISIVPQILSLMAAFSTIMAFDMVKFGDTSTRYFMCKETGDDDAVCFPLVLNDPSYYENSSDEGWASAIQAGALFGIVAAVTGCFALALLITSTCFSLKPRRILAIIILQAIACFFSIFSLIAGAANVCKGVPGDACDDKRGRLHEGALFMMAAFFLYIAAIVMNFFYFATARRQARPISASKDEVQVLTTTVIPPQQQPPTQEDIDVALAPAHSDVDDTENDDGIDV